MADEFSTALPKAASQSFVARQPIFNDRLHVFGYELLFRSGLENYCHGVTFDFASRKVISDSAMVMDLQTLTAGRRAFVNVTEQVVLDGLFEIFPPESTVVELLENVQPTPEVLAACRGLKDKGYLLALDDYVGEPGLEPLLELTDILKVDFLGADADRQREIAERVGPRGVKLLAEKVETREVVADAQSMGYGYFQGYFFSRPVIVSANDITSNKTALLELLEQIHRPELDFRELEAIVRTDMGLCYKLLRFINSAHHSLREPVRSIHRALVLLGEDQVRRWLTLVTLAELGDGQPEELIRHATVRARFCESLGEPFGVPRRHELFLTGMFSLIDAVVGRPLGEVIAMLPIDNEIKDALAGERNELGQIYEYSVAYERGLWDHLRDLVRRIDESVIARLYTDSVSWGVRHFQMATMGS